MVENKDVTAYIAAANSEARPKLEQLRQIISETAPEAEEVISYQIPGYRYKGQLIFFAGYEHHVGLYITGTTSVREKFKEELKDYEQAKSTIQFPLDKPLPIGLIKNIVKHRLAENKAASNNK